jgi:hypothetical protein
MTLEEALEQRREGHWSIHKGEAAWGRARDTHGVFWRPQIAVNTPRPEQALFLVKNHKCVALSV